ncbi:MAG: PDZ domain-containing protein [Verrucomicrobiota bacterium]
MIHRWTFFRIVLPVAVWLAWAGVVTAQQKAWPELVRGLSHESFSHRRIAQEALGKLLTDQPEKWIPICLKTIDGTDEPDVEFRLNEVLFGLFRKRVLEKPRGFLGIRLNGSFLPPDQLNQQLVPCVDVLDIIPDTAAAGSILRIGDKIYEVDGEGVGANNPMGSFIAYIYSKRPDREVHFKVWRTGTKFEMKVSLGLRPVDLPISTIYQKSSGAYYREWLERARTAVEAGEAVVFE